VAAERDWEAIRELCTRYVPAQAAPSRPADVLLELAGRVDDGSGDVYGRGGPVERLELRVAELLGKEAALLFPSGTMAQQVALRIWSERAGSRTIVFHPQCHLEAHEEKAYEWLHGLHAELVGHRERLITVEDLEKIAGPVAALLLELPQRDLGGQLPEWHDLVAQAEWARSRGASLHLDGARLWQCEPFYGRTFAEIAALFDTVYVSLYKDLRGLGGCLLAGPAAVIEEARVWRVRHGGRVASLYPYALSGERGLDEVLPLMPSFVERAREIGAALAGIDGVHVVPDPPQAAMLHVYVPGELERVRDAVAGLAEERSVFVGFFAPTAVPRLQRAELNVGASTLEVPAEEIAELYAEVVRRAGAPLGLDSLGAEEAGQRLQRAVE
jgi:threonine aldolase